MRTVSHRSSPPRQTPHGLAVLLGAALLAGCTSSPAPAGAIANSPATPASSSPPLPPQPATTPSTLTTAPPPAPPTSKPKPVTPRPSTPEPPPPLTPTSVVHHTVSGGRTVALTFDDGPGPATGPVLDLLSQHGARATFCVTGRNATAHPATIQRIQAEGHRLCDHSVNHPQPFAALPHAQQEYEIVAAEEMIVKAGGAGTEVPWFRAPGGAFTPANQLLAARHGLRPLGWSVDTRDWTRPGPAAIVGTVQRDLRPGSVVLLHDGGGDRSQTVTALGQLLPWLQAQGYTFDFPAT